MTGSSTGLRSLAELNGAPDDDRLRADLAACCAAPAWVAALTAGRPFASVAELFAASDAAIAALTDADLAVALAAHPRIGAGPTGDPPAGPDREWSRQEQAGMSTAGAGVRAELVAANLAYEQR